MIFGHAKRGPIYRGPHIFSAMYWSSFTPFINWYRGPPCRDEFVKFLLTLRASENSPASSRKVSLQFETNRNMSVSHRIPCMIYLPIHLVDLYGRMVDVGKYAIHGCYGYPYNHLRCMSLAAKWWAWDIYYINLFALFLYHPQYQYNSQDMSRNLLEWFWKNSLTISCSPTDILTLLNFAPLKIELL